MEENTLIPEAEQLTEQSVAVNEISKEETDACKNEIDLNSEFTLESKPEEKPRKSSKITISFSLNKKILLAVLIILIAAALVTGAFFGVKKINDPENIVDEYVQSLFSGDFESAYDCLDIPYGDQLTKEMYVKVKRASVEAVPKIINNYTITEDEYSGKLTKTYSVKYSSLGTTSSQIMKITAVKQKNKKLFFFDDYKVSVYGLVAETYKLSIPKGSTLFIEDTEISKDNIIESESESESESELKSEYSYGYNSNSNCDTYEIKNWFSGDYKIKITAPYIKDYKKTIAIRDSGNNVITDIEMKSEVQDELSEMGREAIKEMVNGALERKDFYDLKCNFTDDNIRRLNIKNEYESIIEKLESYKVKSVTFSEIQENDYYYNEIFNNCNYFFTYDFTCENEPEQLKDYSGNASFEYEYTDEGKWAISSMSIYLYFDIYDDYNYYE